ncbi:MAG TPA: bifunctional 3,4-dihydroxy-2-butanone-4-phosphate synthase/GTP cyclohydrolase II [Candidatus Kapabacteria bacterium]|jgi:3,4-dihydroxy 2-butanone 4-phosphate synthase/GTP cyclohydrolase II|nr:bifunctional 3,4-dihydroxy-2-butanone-4-phosphate synthase/GTP cyclohydrolase II [Ignavibacteria bacterium]HRK58736.1 bifunctional 3,4-dihydroxy-2-butanone-4-phosphate synthase/GTP cyclohydrolase II [Candidatus Kapabacteria bacterium]
MRKFDTIESAVADLQAGKIVIVVDDEDRENEGDVICASQFTTPDMINFMAVHARGLICTSITQQRAEELELTSMVADNTALHGTRFTVSVDYVHGTTSGISAHDRAATVQALINPQSKPEDFGRPGHIFPLVACPGGVLRRAGHTEAVIDLMKLADLQPSGVLCEILADDGTMARGEELFDFAEKHSLKLITVKDLIAYRLEKESLVRFVAEAQLPTEYGNFQVKIFENITDGKEHLALVKGEISADEPILVRAHSECMTGDIFHSLRCDCGKQLHRAMEMIEHAGKGVILYMRQEGRGIGLTNKIKAYSLQEQGMNTIEANEALGFKPDARDYGIGAQILNQLGVRKMMLMTNNPTKRVGLESYGLEVVDRVPIEIEPVPENEEYLKTKKYKMGHILKHL